MTNRKTAPGKGGRAMKNGRARENGRARKVYDFREENIFEKRRERLLALLAANGREGSGTGQRAELINPPTLVLASDYFDLAGEEFGRRLVISDGSDGLKYCLRPDFTLPIARHYMKTSPLAPAAYGYLGPVFRQRSQGPCEFEQAGLELIAQQDADQALYRVFDFARDGLALYGISSPGIRLGSIALFEALLQRLDMPDVWRPRLRRRFGSSKAMEALLLRLSPGAGDAESSGNSDEERLLKGLDRERLLDWISRKMLGDGLSLIEGRLPEEIASRYLEKQALSAARVPGDTVGLLRRYLSISDRPEPALDLVRQLLEKAGIDLKDQVEILRSHARQLSLRFPGAPLKLELGFSPRLHYYTGLVFELTGQNAKTLASGGQYDRLLRSLGAGRDISASGCALWVNRLEKEATGPEGGQGNE